MEYIIEKNKTILKLGTKIDLHSVILDLSILKKIIALHQPILIEAHELLSIDAAGLQLLLSFYLTAIQNKISVEWHKPTKTLHDSAKLIGIQSLLGLTSVEEGGVHAN